MRNKFIENDEYWANRNANNGQRYGGYNNGGGYNNCGCYNNNGGGYNNNGGNNRAGNNGGQQPQQPFHGGNMNYGNGASTQPGNLPPMQGNGGPPGNNGNNGNGNGGNFRPRPPQSVFKYDEVIDSRELDKQHIPMNKDKSSVIFATCMTLSEEQQRAIISGRSRLLVVPASGNIRESDQMVQLMQESITMDTKLNRFLPYLAQIRSVGTAHGLDITTLTSPRVCEPREIPIIDDDDEMGASPAKESDDDKLLNDLAEQVRKLKEKMKQPKSETPSSASSSSQSSEETAREVRAQLRAYEQQIRIGNATNGFRGSKSGSRATSPLMPRGLFLEKGRERDHTGDTPDPKKERQ